MMILLSAVMLFLLVILWVNQDSICDWAHYRWYYRKFSKEIKEFEGVDHQDRFFLVKKKGGFFIWDSDTGAYYIQPIHTSRPSWYGEQALLTHLKDAKKFSKEDTLEMMRAICIQTHNSKEYVKYPHHY